MLWFFTIFSFTESSISLYRFETYSFYLWWDGSVTVLYYHCSTVQKQRRRYMSIYMLNEVPNYLEETEHTLYCLEDYFIPSRYVKLRYCALFLLSMKVTVKLLHRRPARVVLLRKRKRFSFKAIC